jgi:hypothetical protein
MLEVQQVTRRTDYGAVEDNVPPVQGTQPAGVTWD